MRSAASTDSISRLTLAGVVIAAILIATALVSQPVAAQEREPAEKAPALVSSDGTSVPIDATALKSAATMVPAAAPQGLDAAEGVDFDEDLELGPFSEIGINAVIGDDTRSRTTPTDWRPASSTVMLTTEVNGTHVPYCSGWLIGPDTVITAGHCVYSHSSGNPGWRTGEGLRAWPGRDGGSAPYGSCTADSLHTVNLWIETTDHPERSNWDYGAIKLNCTVGNATGTYGFYWQSASLDGTGTSTRGYPGDKPDGQQWASYDQVRVTEDRRVFYDNDTVGGQSGSPVYTYRDTCNGPCAMAIHNNGRNTGLGSPFNDHNWGTRINEEVFGVLQYWRDL